MASDKAKMQLKIIHVKSQGNDDDFELIGQPKVFMVDRSVDTYETLKKMTLQDFFGGEDQVNPDLYRLRSFNMQFSIMMDTYEGREDLTLQQLKIYPMKTLVLEERKSVDVPFEAYDPTKMQIKVNFWTADIYKEHMSLLDYVESMHARVRVPREMPLTEFKAYLQSKFNFTHVVVMKRTPLSQERDVD